MVSDITYIWTDEGWLYLAVVLDFYSRKVIGWAMAERNDRQPNSRCLDHGIVAAKAPKKRHRSFILDQPVIVRRLPRLTQTTPSSLQRAKKRGCYDNAAMESWNHSFKVEATHGERLITRVATRQHVFEYIEAYYNRKRFHSKLGYLSLKPLNLNS